MNKTGYITIIIGVIFLFVVVQLLDFTKPDKVLDKVDDTSENVTLHENDDGRVDVIEKRESKAKQKVMDDDDKNLKKTTKNIESYDPKSYEAAKLMVKDQPKSRFSSIEITEIHPEIISQSKNWISRFFKSEAFPFAAESLVVKVYYAQSNSPKNYFLEGENDLIQYTWTYKSNRLRIVESINAVQLEIDLSAYRDSNRMSMAPSVVSSLLRLQDKDINGVDYSIHLEWPQQIDGGVQFGWNTDRKIILMSYWHERVDAYIETKKLSLILYKKIPQLIGFQNGYGWLRKNNEEM